jgi:peptidoglycan/LPS O-acetylase OafA/YrhL
MTKIDEPLLRPVMPELDSIRGIAILAVLIYHGFYWGTDLTVFPRFERLIITSFWAGRLGVNLFFVLSGFLITGLLLDSRERNDYYRHFYILRALRILPAYLATMAILAATHYATSAFILLSLAYLSNLTPLFGVSISYPVLWSLAVEEHFYLIWPTIVRRLSRHALLYSSVAIIVFSPICRLFSFYLAQSKGFVSYVINDYTWNSADGLACGAVLAIILREYDLDRRRVLQACYFCILLAVAIWILGLPFGIVSRQTPVGTALQVVPWHFLFVALLGIFLVVGTGERQSIVRVRFLRFFGEISYGLYLIQLLVFDSFDWIARRYVVPGMGWSKMSDLTVRFVYVACASVVLAYVSRRQFEDRFLQLKNRLS